jgi:lactoylglutathione lyase
MSVLVHTSIRTSDMDSSIEFYTKLMGLKLLGRHEIPKNNAEIAFLQDPDGKGSRLELTFYKNQKKFVQADYEDRLFDHIAFEVDDMEKAISSLRRAKVTITDEPFRLSPAGSLIAFVEDPDGILIELIEKK